LVLTPSAFIFVLMSLELSAALLVQHKGLTDPTDSNTGDR